VDYARRQGLLQALQVSTQSGLDRQQLAGDLIETRDDGRIKLYVTWQALQCRQEHPGLFTSGAYHPANADGPGAKNVFGFVRRAGSVDAIVAIPRLLTATAPDGQLPLGKDVWKETTLQFIGINAGCRFRNVFTGEVLAAGGKAGVGLLKGAEIFGRFPVALLVSSP
jgi:(1->4)-alpha-D-glucan 1-alpha-D-glucosylmutase